MTDKTEILEIHTYPIVVTTIEALAKGRGLTASEFGEQILMNELDELWERSQKIGNR
ncbi:MAG: hypothetical protein ABR985_11370 [Methanotrichaceae archaeon]|jgi:hypothetical protein